MSIPTLQELREMKENWLNDPDILNVVRYAKRVTSILGEPMVIGTYPVQRLVLGTDVKWHLTYSRRETTYNPVRKAFNEREGLLIEDSARRVWVRYITINGIPTNDCHIVPGDWRIEVGIVRDVAEARLQSIQDRSDEEERMALARQLLFI